MRYLLAIGLLVSGFLPLVLEHDGTVFLLCLAAASALIFSRTDWTKGPYERSWK